MSTFSNVTHIEEGRPHPGTVRRRIIAAGFAVVAIVTVAAGIPRTAHADASPTYPVGTCSDFGCER